VGYFQTLAGAQTPAAFGGKQIPPWVAAQIPLFYLATVIVPLHRRLWRTPVAVFLLPG